MKVLSRLNNEELNEVKKKQTKKNNMNELDVPETCIVNVGDFPGLLKGNKIFRSSRRPPRLWPQTKMVYVSKMI